MNEKPLPRTVAGRFATVMNLLDPVFTDALGGEIHCEPLITLEQAMELLKFTPSPPRLPDKDFDNEQT